MAIHIDSINALIDAAKRAGLSKLEVTEYGVKLEFPSSAQMSSGGHSSIEAAANAIGNAASAAPNIEATGNVVAAPIVGTFYSRPAPDKPPFVAVGQTVKRGDTLFIIESMKLMNEVESEFDGVVKAILVSDGDAVEFGQTVMVIE